MCILFLAINQHPKHPVIICANRDEFYARPTKSVHFWQETPSLLAGKDLQAGGSWLGVNSLGYFAAITNIRTGIKQSVSKKSRGELVTKALQEDSRINLDWLLQNSDQYNPFNLTYGHINQLSCYNSLLKEQTCLGDGFHAVSNGALNDVWPKMAKGERHLELLVGSKQAIDNEQLFKILRDQTQPRDSELPNTGIPIEWERKLSSIFINSSDYGTRSSTLVTQNVKGTINFVECEYNDEGIKSRQNEFVLDTTQR